ncbi:hypothetical protein XENOCAPTIV_028517 [Xenoophorus captivus]|uniref:Uncharacterized protein n=1 Tax=Xenoophorus captivus TaxID=1517983 RepID=A0ABV0S3L8_9TELE
MSARTALSRGLTAQRLCKNVTLYLNELTSPGGRIQSQTPDDQKPLTLMLPWLGSRPQAVAKYCEIYFRSGFDVLVIKDFLWPRWGLDRGKQLLELLQIEPLKSRPLLIHAFSIGGYTFGQLLVHISQDQQQYQAVTNRIKAQVYDSLVIGSLEHMATVDYFNSSIDIFYNTPVRAPALVFFCENDLLSDAPTVEKLMDFWQKRGMDITAKKWKVSTHAGHLRRHPQEYLSTLETFLHSIQIAPLKAKM